jgi:hypothetical protein
MRSCIRIAALIVICLGLGGCILSRQHGSSWRLPTRAIPTSGSILVAEIPDGGGEDGVMVGSGGAMTLKIQQLLLKKGFKTTTTTFRRTTELLEEARTARADLLLVGRISKWEDNFTEWSSQRDFAGLILQLYDVSSGEMISSSDRMIEGTSTPDECADELAETSVHALLSERVLNVRPKC